MIPILKQLSQIQKVLSKTFIHQKNLINRRVQTLRNKLLQLHNQIQTLSIREKSFLSSHATFAYFCREFNCHEIPLEIGTKEPTAKYLEEIISSSNKLQTKLMVIIPHINDQGANRIAEKLQLFAIYFDPFSSKYFENLLLLAQNIKNSNNE